MFKKSTIVPNQRPTNDPSVRWRLCLGTINWWIVCIYVQGSQWTKYGPVSPRIITYLWAFQLMFQVNQQIHCKLWRSSVQVEWTRAKADSVFPAKANCKLGTKATATIPDGSTQTGNWPRKEIFSCSNLWKGFNVKDHWVQKILFHKQPQSTAEVSLEKEVLQYMSLKSQTRVLLKFEPNLLQGRMPYGKFFTCICHGTANFVSVQKHKLSFVHSLPFFHGPQHSTLQQGGCKCRVRTVLKL